MNIKEIKWFFTDVDGVLTDGCVYYSSQGEELKKFSLRDGMGLERLRKYTDIQVGIITGENSEIVQRRAEKLKIDCVFLGIKDKKSVLETFLKEKNLTFSNIAYMGDDFNDLEVIRSAGIVATPKDGIEEIKELANFISEKKGGDGAFRSFCEYLIHLNSQID